MIWPSYLAAISIVALLLLVRAAVAQQQGEEETSQDEEVVFIRDDSFVPGDAIAAQEQTVTG